MKHALSIHFHRVPSPLCKERALSIPILPCGRWPVLVCLGISHVSHWKFHTFKIFVSWTSQDIWSPVVDLRFCIYCKKYPYELCLLLPLLHIVFWSFNHTVIWGCYTHFTDGKWKLRIVTCPGLVTKQWQKQVWTPAFLGSGHLYTSPVER